MVFQIDNRWRFTEQVWVPVLVVSESRPTGQGAHCCTVVPPYIEYLDLEYTSDLEYILQSVTFLV